jgi:hypothetical protein
MNDKQGIFSRSGQAGREQSRIVRKPVAGAPDSVTAKLSRLRAKSQTGTWPRAKPRSARG